MNMIIINGIAIDADTGCRIKKKKVIGLPKKIPNTINGIKVEDYDVKPLIKNKKGNKLQTSGGIIECKLPIHSQYWNVKQTLALKERDLDKGKQALEECAKLMNM